MPYTPMNGQRTVLPRVLFIVTFVPPGVPFDDEPNETVPAGWHVRLDGLTPDERDAAAWRDQWWISHYFGPRAQDHLEAVIAARVANEHWSLRGYAPECARDALDAALNELAGG